MGLSRRAVLANAMVLGVAAASGPISAATKRCGWWGSDPISHRGSRASHCAGTPSAGAAIVL